MTLHARHYGWAAETFGRKWAVLDKDPAKSWDSADFVRVPVTRDIIQAREGRRMRVSRLTWLILVIATLVLLSTAGQIVGVYTDWLWFGEVQFTSVFVTVLRTQILLGLVTGVAFFVILYG